MQQPLYVYVIQIGVFDSPGNVQILVFKIYTVSVVVQFRCVPPTQIKAPCLYRNLPQQNWLVKLFGKLGSMHGPNC